MEDRRLLGRSFGQGSRVLLASGMYCVVFRGHVIRVGAVDRVSVLFIKVLEDDLDGYRDCARIVASGVYRV